MGQDFTLWPGIITYLVYSKLDDYTQIEWKKTLSDQSKYPEWERLRSFLKTNAFAVSSISGNFPHKKEPKYSDVKNVYVVPEKVKCIACTAHHLLIECEVFKNKTPFERLSLIRSKNVCPNCFNSGHSQYQCKSRKACKICFRKHHTLLHLENTRPKTETPTKENPKNSNSEENAPKDQTKKSSSGTALKISSPFDRETVVLPSAVATFQSGLSRGTIRLLLDNCSQVTLISDAFVRKHRLATFKSENPKALAVGGVKFQVTRQCSLEIRSKVNKFTLQLTAEVVPTNALSYELHNLSVPGLQNLLRPFVLADSAFRQKIINIPKIDVLLGASCLPAVLLSENQNIKGLSLQNTQFGWTIMGPVPENPLKISISTETSCNLSIQDIDDRLKQFWEMDESLDNLKESATESEQCNHHFEKNYLRVENGQFQVRLAFKESPDVLTNNRAQALAQFRRYERFTSESRKSQYVEFMREYISLQHMQPAALQNVSRYFIQHHSIQHQASTTTKFRVVFNASAKTASGKSLNDVLLKGPIIQPDLFDLLILFRSHLIAFTADIEKMYRCVLLHPQDRPWQTILWREEHASPVEEFELHTVTYGTKPASFLATKCLEVLGNTAKNPIVSEAIKSHF